MDLPKNPNRLDPVYIKWTDWKTERLKELWFLWDAEIRKERAVSRFIPNGFPDKILNRKAFRFFLCRSAGTSRIDTTMVKRPWSQRNKGHTWNEATGRHIQCGSRGRIPVERFRTESDAEIRIWVAEGVANGLLPCFVKFGAVPYDKRWFDTVSDMYQVYHRGEKYLRNTASLARVGMVYSEATDRKYGGKPWQQRSGDHSNGMYHALVEARMPFEMVNDRLFDADALKNYKLLVLPNIAALSDAAMRSAAQICRTGW